jgi:LacI family transcriptional regulator
MTVKDIAKKAGVSASTVSAVLNNRQIERRISPSSVEKVLAAARSLGYVPNIAARRLRDQPSGNRQVVIGILTSYEAPVRLVSQTLHALEQRISQADPQGTTYSVIIEIFHAGRLRDLPGFIDGRRFNGAIITNTVAEDDNFLATARLPFPVVLVGRSIPGYPGVNGSPQALGAEAARILESAGRQRLAVLCPRVLTQATERRLSGFFEAAIRQTGSLPDKIVSPNLSASGGCEAMREYLKRGGQCDGLFVVTDALALGAYHSIKRVGRRIPDDIAVVGVGDQENGPFLDPPLTSFSSGQEAMNQQVAAMLISMLSGETVSPYSLDVPLEIRLRESTGHSSRVPGE